MNHALVSAIANSRTPTEELDGLVGLAARALSRTVDESVDRLATMEQNGHMVRVRRQIEAARRAAYNRHFLTPGAFADLVGERMGRPVSPSLLVRGRPKIPHGLLGR